MPQETLFIDGIVLEQWPVEAPIGTPHNEVVDEGIWWANDLDYCQANQVNTTDTFSIEAGVPGKKWIQNFRFLWRFMGTWIIYCPGLRLSVFVGGIQYGEDILVKTVYHAYQNAYVEFKNVNIPGVLWYAGPRQIVVKVISLAGGPPPPIPEHG